MGSIVIVVIVVALLVVGPFKLAAGWLGADRSDWVSCFVAVLIASVLGGGLTGALGGGVTWAFFGAAQGMISLALVVLISGLTNRIVLGTTFVRGVFITAIGSLILPVTLVVAMWLGAKVFAS